MLFYKEEQPKQTCSAPVAQLTFANLIREAPTQRSVVDPEFREPGQLDRFAACRASSCTRHNPPVHSCEGVRGTVAHLGSDI